MNLSPCRKCCTDRFVMRIREVASGPWKIGCKACDRWTPPIADDMECRETWAEMNGEYRLDHRNDVRSMDGMEFSDRIIGITGSSEGLVLALSHLEDEMRALGMDLDVSYADDALMRLDREVHVYVDGHYRDLHDRNVGRTPMGPDPDMVTLAGSLDGIEIWDEIPEDMILFAKERGLVIAFGGSDDLFELRGAFCDELGAYVWDGYVAKRFTSSRGRTIDAMWCDGETSWSYRTDIPHTTFRILENDELYCIGIVFRALDGEEWTESDELVRERFGHDSATKRPFTIWTFHGTLTRPLRK